MAWRLASFKGDVDGHRLKSAVAAHDTGGGPGYLPVADEDEQTRLHAEAVFEAGRLTEWLGDVGC